MPKFDVDQRTISKVLTNYKLNVPNFQRKYRWNKDTRKRLIESLQGEFPIGVIVLYEDKKEYLIIDGVQRINTLKLYLSEPSQIIEPIDHWSIIEQNVKIFQSQHSFLTIKQYQKIIYFWYRNLKKMLDFEKLSNLEIAFNDLKLYSKIPTSLSSIKFLEELKEIITKPLNIKDQEVAIIFYRGSRNDLPQLFKNINTGSIPLSPYELYQSLWEKYVVNQELFSKYKKYYEFQISLLSETYYEFDSTIDEGNADIYKLLAALSNKINTIKDLDKVFYDMKKSTPSVDLNGETLYYTKENLGFELVSVLLTNKPNGINSAVEKIIFNEKNNYRNSMLNTFIFNLVDSVFNTIQILPTIFTFESFKGKESQITRYHSFYNFAVLYFSKYLINSDTLEVLPVDINEMRNELSIERVNYRIKNEWFRDKHRQLSFFQDKIKDLKMTQIAHLNEESEKYYSFNLDEDDE